MNMKARYVLRWLGAVILFPIFIISFFVPRDSNIIIFGGRDANKFMDNTKYLFIVMNKYIKNKKIIFITKNKELIKKLRGRGYQVEYIYSLKSFWYHLRAKYYFVDNTLGYLVPLLGFLAGSAKIIQLWHGIGFKKIEFTLYNIRNFLDKLKLIHILPWTYYFCDLYVLAPTVFYAKYFTKVFRVPLYKIIIAAYPRDDVFFIDKDELKNYLTKNKELELFKKIIKLKKSGSKLILYAPTFRDTRRNIDIFKEAELDIDLLNQILIKNDGYLILKLHPAEKGNLTDIKRYKRILIAPSDVDIYPILPHIDLFITDYSSIFADYLYTSNPILFFAFDFDYYVNKDRAMIVKRRKDYEKEIPGFTAYDSNELLQILDGLLNSNQLLYKKFKKLYKKRIYKYIYPVKNFQRPTDILITKLKEIFKDDFAK